MPISSSLSYSAALLALAVFWAVGAWARLQRLRRQVSQAQQPLQQLWQEQLALARRLCAQLQALPAVTLDDDLAPDDLETPEAGCAACAQRLKGAIRQFELAAARLQRQATRAQHSDWLALARTVLHTSWDQAVACLEAAEPRRLTARDLADAPGQGAAPLTPESIPVPEPPTDPVPQVMTEALPLSSRWQVLHHQEMLPLHGFNTALHSYNQAVRQFPALLLARTWGLRPGRLLRIGPHT